MLYPAQLQQEKETFIVLFRDVPEALTQGRDWEETLEMAEDALKTASEFYKEDGRVFPDPSSPERGDVMISFNIEEVV